MCVWRRRLGPTVSVNAHDHRSAVPLTDDAQAAEGSVVSLHLESLRTEATGATAGGAAGGRAAPAPPVTITHSSIIRKV